MNASHGIRPHTICVLSPFRPRSLTNIYTARLVVAMTCRSTKRSNEITDQISVSVLEIYCEQIRDLLSDNVSSATFIYI